MLWIYDLVLSSPSPWEVSYQQRHSQGTDFTPNHAASESGAGSSLGSVPKEPTLLGTTPHRLLKF